MFCHFFWYPSVYFLPLQVQANIEENKVESSADGEEDGSREEQNKLESDKTEEGCGKIFKITSFSTGFLVNYK